MVVGGNATTEADLQIKTLSVQQILAPLINQVASLANDSQKTIKRFRSKSGRKLLTQLNESLKTFETIGNQLLVDNPDLQSELTNALEEIMTAGDQMLVVSRQFLSCPQEKKLREPVADYARRLLFAVTRLLVLADIIDCRRISNAEKNFVEQLNLSKKKNFDIRILQRQIEEIDALAERRQKDLISGLDKEKIAVLRNCVKQQMELLRSSLCLQSKHGGIKQMRELFRTDLQNNLSKLVAICTSTVPAEVEFSCIDVPARLEAFLKCVSNEVKANNYSGKRDPRPILENMLENAVRDIGLLIDSGDRSAEDRQRIANLCNGLRQSLQNFLKANSKLQPVDIFIDELEKQCKELRKKLRKILTDQYNSMIVRPERMIAPFESLSRKQVTADKFLKSFNSALEKLIDISRTLSTFTEEAVYKRCIDIAIELLNTSTAQVVQSAKCLNSGEDNLVHALWDQVKSNWIGHAHLLLDSVDEACRIEDLLSSCDHCILDEITKCLQMSGEGVRFYGQRAILRSLRLLSIVTSEMNRYEPGEYTQLVDQAIQLLSEEGLPAFRDAVGEITSTNDQLVHAANVLYDGVREIRCAVLMNSALELPSDSDEAENEENTYSRMSSPAVERPMEPVDRNGHLMNTGPHECIPREVMRQLPQEEMEQIEKQVRVLKRQKRAFDREVLKWDEKGNDIVMLARKMCVIMMEMSEFTRGEGPLRGTMDVINAAKKISDYGARLDKVARNIVTECVESQSKQDLLAYLDRISLFTHQLNITSRVKADVQNISGELVVSGLDSAISLITSAKNLMNAVIAVVKASYIASTKYRHRNREGSSNSNHQNPTSPTIVQWHMKPPEKKPLFVGDQDILARVRSDCDNVKDFEAAYHS